MITEDELQALAAILEAAGREEVMSRFRRLGSEAIRAKTGPQDLVTEADEAAERAITAALRARFPGCIVIGEEAVSADPQVLQQLKGAKLAFVIDPIDGTFNYQAGIGLFGVMGAVVEDGRITAGVIHDPIVEDSSCALAGHGAWTQGSGTKAGQGRTPLHVAAPEPIADMAGILSYTFMQDPLKTRVANASAKLLATWNYRCASQEYRIATSGQCHFLIYGRLLPWDHAAGWIIHKEAGGYSARLDGNPYDPTESDGELIYAPDRASWQALRDLIG